MKSVLKSCKFSLRSLCSINKAFFQIRLHQVLSPYDNRVVCEMPFKNEKEASEIFNKAGKIQKSWQYVPLEERIKAVKHAMQYFKDNSEQIAKDISNQMGKPIKESRAEVTTNMARAEKMMEIAKDVLEPETLQINESGFLKMRREPVGVVLVISPWNFPLMTAIGPVVCSVLAGNTVVIKHSSSTPMCGKMYQDAFKQSNTVFDCFTDRRLANKLIHDLNVGFVSFTGSVNGGRQVFQQVANSQKFFDTGLELGGKDGFYVADDILSVKDTVASLLDGAFYNCGQSCCSVERIYVHKDKYKDFLHECSKFKDFYKLGDPLDEATTMGPMCLQESPAFIQKQVKDAQNGGAKVLFGGKAIKDQKGKGRFFEPTVVYDTSQRSSLMSEESFGPVVGIQSVENDEEGLKMVNDSQFGLTGGIFTASLEKAQWFGERLEAGTAFMNKSDFLHPLLAWSGRKDTGKGVSLSKYGFYAVTQSKSFNYKFKP